MLNWFSLKPATVLLVLGIISTLSHQFTPAAIYLVGWALLQPKDPK